MKKKSFLPVIGLTFILCTFLILSCGKKHDNGNSITIGVIGPFEGDNAHIGKIIMNSVKLFYDKNKIDGLDIKLVPVDDKSNPSDAVAAVQTSVANKNIKAFIGFYNSSTAIACKPIIQEAKVPTLIYSASNPKVTETAPYYFRMVPTDDNQAIVLTDYTKQLGAKKVAILYYADEYGKGLSDGIQKRAKEIGTNIISIQSYDATTSDFRPVLTVIKGKNPDVVVICGFIEKSIAILNQSAEKGLKCKFLAGDGTFNEEELIKGCGTNAEGVYVAAPYVFDEANQKNKEFLENYWKSYDFKNERRKPASWSAYAYDAAEIIYNALKAGKKDRNSIYEYLGGMNSPEKGFTGITGLTYFNEKGNAVGRNFRLAVVHDQHFTAAK